MSVLIQLKKTNEFQCKYHYILACLLDSADQETELPFLDFPNPLNLKRVSRCVGRMGILPACLSVTSVPVCVNEAVKIG